MEKIRRIRREGKIANVILNRDKEIQKFLDELAPLNSDLESFNFDFYIKKYDIKEKEQPVWSMCMCDTEKYKIMYENERRLRKNNERIEHTIRKIKDDVEKLKIKNKIERTICKEKEKNKSITSLFYNFISEIESAYEWPIKQDKVVDPVLTPNGVTYEKAMITKFIKSSKRDPLTNKRLTPSKLIPNIAIKKVISIVNSYRKTLSKLEING